MIAYTRQRTVIPNENWLNDAENMLIYTDDYPEIPIGRCLEASRLKLQTGSGDVEVEILAQCNGKLTKFA